MHSTSPKTKEVLTTESETLAVIKPDQCGSTKLVVQLPVFPNAENDRRQMSNYTEKVENWLTLTPSALYLLVSVMHTNQFMLFVYNI